MLGRTRSLICEFSIENRERYPVQHSTPNKALFLNEQSNNNDSLFDNIENPGVKALTKKSTTSDEASTQFTNPQLALNPQSSDDNCLFELVEVTLDANSPGKDISTVSEQPTLNHQSFKLYSRLTQVTDQDSSKRSNRWPSPTS